MSGYRVSVYQASGYRTSVYQGSVYHWMQLSQSQHAMHSAENSCCVCARSSLASDSYPEKQSPYYA